MSPSGAAVRAGAAVVSAFAFASCGHAPNASLPEANFTQQDTRGFSAPAVQKYLYSVSAEGPVYAYPLPITAGEKPSAILKMQAGGIADGGGNLYVSLKNGTEIARYRTPLTSGEKSSGIVALTSINVLGYGPGYVYVGDGGSGNRTNEIASYVAPLRRGEHASAVVKLGTPLLDFPDAFALGPKFLYALCNNALLAYALPLTTGEAASVTVGGFDSAIGVAISGDRLYVSSYDLADVFVYALPLQSGAKPITTLSTGFVWAGPLAADENNLYVSDTSGSAWVYPLPIHAGEQPVTSISNSRNAPAQTLAVGP